MGEELITVISCNRDLVAINSGGVDPMSLIVYVILVTSPGVVALGVRGDVGLRIRLWVRAGVHLPEQTLLVRELCSGHNTFRNEVPLVARGDILHGKERLELRFRYFVKARALVEAVWHVCVDVTVPASSKGGGCCVLFVSGSILLNDCLSISFTLSIAFGAFLIVVVLIILLLFLLCSSVGLLLFFLSVNGGIVLFLFLFAIGRVVTAVRIITLLIIWDAIVVSIVVDRLVHWVS